MIVGIKEWVNDHMCFFVHCNHVSPEATLWELGFVWKTFITKIWFRWKLRPVWNFHKCGFEALVVNDMCYLMPGSPGNRLWNAELCTRFYSIFERCTKHPLHVYTRWSDRSEPEHFINTLYTAIPIQDILSLSEYIVGQRN